MENENFRAPGEQSIYYGRTERGGGGGARGRPRGGGGMGLGGGGEERGESINCK